ncbi:hypothetical protein BJ138DRAFT_1142801 [Hygrophoropsis aurantiaca]|uniref:Uncharacterized protein n=1 Tax=Hygrophoropsis aurantiaca TaxID=72124 RepID=A0ACB8AQ60_9AGAM|nr:hypothetical protein BJ138DRAFT_1142801 [Hygrophoropsis aurantiaca]
MKAIPMFPPILPGTSFDNPFINPEYPPTSFIHPDSLPIPGAADLGPKFNKPSHARRQPPGHVPRPRNAFILFRCDFVRQRKIPESVEKDNRNLSRIAGRLWQEMSEQDKQPWVVLAMKEKQKHAAMYPNYRYSPMHGLTARTNSSAKSKLTKGSNDPEGEEREHKARLADMSSFIVQNDTPGRELQRGIPKRRGLPQSGPCSVLPPPRRSSSCPPVGSIPMPTYAQLQSWANSLTTQDDLARRPSRTTMYHSVTSEPIAPVAETSVATYAPWISVPVPFEWPTLQQTWDPLMGPSFLDTAQFTSPFDLSDQHFELPSYDDNNDNINRMARLSLAPNFTNPFDSEYSCEPKKEDLALSPLAMTVSPLDLHASVDTSDHAHNPFVTA